MGRSIFICWLFSSSASGVVFVLVLLPPREKSYRPFPSPFKFLPVICIILLTILFFLLLLRFTFPWGSWRCFRACAVATRRELPSTVSISSFLLALPVFSHPRTSWKQPNTSFFIFVILFNILKFYTLASFSGPPKVIFKASICLFFPFFHQVIFLTCISVTFHKGPSSLGEIINAPLNNCCCHLEEGGSGEGMWGAWLTEVMAKEWTNWIPASHP